MNLLNLSICQRLWPIVKGLCLTMPMVLLSFCLASSVMASVRGEAELTYTDYVASEDGRKVSEMSSFTQNYSLFYHKNGSILDPRFGRYTLGLGYQWSSVDTSFNDEDRQYSDGKFLYQGEVNIAPGGLPFRLRAYSFDLQTPTFSTRRPRGSIIDAPLIYDLQAGVHTVSGLTLVAGIQNGSYLGKFRSYLSMFPRIFIDYQENKNHNDSGFARYDNRTRDLAFVSLNKKDNWFHYRAKEYKDFYHNENDYYEQSFMLGTVDHRLKRQWINMTNWIKISVDGSLTSEETPDYQISSIDPDTYDLNLFAIANYNKTRLANFNHFSRVVHSDGMQKNLETPMYLDGWLDPNRSWSIQFQNNNNDDSFKRDTSVYRKAFSNQSSQYLSGQLNIGHQQAVKFVSTLEIESYRSDAQDAYGARARFEMSNQHYQDKKVFLLGSSATYVNSDGKEVIGQSSSGQPQVKQSASGDVFEQDLYGSVDWLLTPRNTFTATQNFQYSTGELFTRQTKFIRLRGVPRNDQTNEASSNSFYSSETLLGLETIFSARLKNRITLFNNSTFGGIENFSQTSLGQKLTYSQAKLRYTMENTLSFGDALYLPSATFTNDRSFSGTGRAIPGDINYVLTHDSYLQYYPLRNFKSDARLKFKLYGGDDDNSYQGEFDQSSQYTFYSRYGGTREIANVYQEFQYEKFSTGGSSSSYLKFLVGVGYLPYRFITFNSDLTYESFEPVGIKALSLATRLAMNFNKVSCEASYAYGLGKFDGASFDDRKEHLFQAKVKRIF